MHSSEKLVPALIKSIKDPQGCSVSALSSGADYDLFTICIPVYSLVYLYSVFRLQEGVRLKGSSTQFTLPVLNFMSGTQK